VSAGQRIKVLEILLKAKKVAVYNMSEKGYKKLDTWKKAHQLVLMVYKLSDNFPSHESFGLTSQLRRAVLSVSVNIVEGHASVSKKEFLNFLNIANRSLVETEYLLEVAMELGYLSLEKYQETEIIRNDVGLLLNRLIRSIRDRLSDS
jgi:four helix bundle protein